MENEQRDPYPFQTYDLALAAALLTAGHQLAEVDKTNPNHCIFLFESSSELQQTQRDYWDRKLTGDLKTFYENLKLLRKEVKGVSKS